MKTGIASHAAVGCAAAALASGLTYLALAGWPDALSPHSAHAQAPAPTGTRQVELFKTTMDDVMGRVKAYESIVKGETLAEPGIPESFKILVNELRSLCLKVAVEDANSKELPLKDLDELGGGDDMRLARSVGFFN